MSRKDKRVHIEMHRRPWTDLIGTELRPDEVEVTGEIGAALGLTLIRETKSQRKTRLQAKSQEKTP